MHSKRSTNSYDEPLIYSEIKRSESPTTKRSEHLIDDRSRDGKCLCEHQIDAMKNKENRPNNTDTNYTSPDDKSLYTCE